MGNLLPVITRQRTVPGDRSRVPGDLSSRCRTGGPGAELRCHRMDPEPGPATGTAAATSADGRTASTALAAPLQAGHADSGTAWAGAKSGWPRSPLPLATCTHIATLVGAFAFWVWLDRGLWFFGDEWDFLVQRGLSYGPTNPSSIWFPHNEHWSTLPILLWRALFGVFGLGSYWPYLVPLLLAQIVVMHLVWRLCIKAGAAPWVATAAVALLGLLGAGAEDLTWAFQIGFVGSVMFGVLAFDILDHRDSGTSSARRHAGLTSRDAIASIALVASLMCSTIGNAMVVGAAVLASARLPRRRVFNVIAPPVAAYALWFALVGHLGLAAHSDRVSLTTLTNLPGYVWTGLSAALGQSFNLPSAGGALLVCVAVWVAYHSRALWYQAPAVLGLCAAVLVFYALAAMGRDASTVSPAVPRYVYIAIALFLPAVAKLLSPARTSTSRVAVLGAVTLLAVSTLGNVGQAQRWASSRVALTSLLKTDVFAAARLLGAGVQDVSGPGAAPIGAFPNLTAAGLAHLERSHELPAFALSAQDLVNARTLLAIGDWDGSATALTPRPLFAGRFEFVKSTYSTVHALPGHCLVFDPEAANPPIQVWLRMAPGEPSASVRAIVPPAAGTSANYLAGVLVPPTAPSSSVPVELTVPAKGMGYLDDNDPQAELVVMWNVGTPLTLCGL